MNRNRPPLILLVGSLIIGASTVVGCDSLLMKPPLGQETSDTFFETAEHAIQATNATYNQLREWQVHVFSFLGMTDIASDDATKGSTPADAPHLLELDNLGFDAGNIAFNEVWGGYYRGIYRANLAILNIPGIDMDPQLRDRLVGENKFLRAYYYFFLVRAFGGVPLISAPLRQDEFEQPRASAEEIYELIEQDLLFAAEKLPPQYGAADVGRATRGAAHGLLAQAYLYWGRYQLAEFHARQVIQSPNHALLPDFGRIFTREGENSSETIFEVQAVALEQGGGGTQYSQVQGVRGTPNLGWGFNQPSDDLDNAFEPGDLRHGATILFPWQLVPDGSGQFVWHNLSIENQRYNRKAFVSSATPGGTENAGTNIRRLRYSDVLLIAAEASYRIGNIPEAQRLLNDVRARARGGIDATIGVITEDISNYLATHMGLTADERGAMVRRARGVAIEAGIGSFQYRSLPGVTAPLLENVDVILSVDGARVATTTEFLDQMRTKSPGQDVEIEVLHLTQRRVGARFETTKERRALTIQTTQRLPDVTATGQALLEAIWHERRVELAMEQHRWFDINRQGRAAEIMQAVGKNYQVGRHELYPIPQREIDLSGGRMTQNPGY
jgi:hypothetical protein